MTANLLSLALLNDPNYTLQATVQEQLDSEAGEGIASFELLSDEGVLVGYVKTWHEDDDLAGFVHFDADGNVIDWNVFSRARPPEVPKSSYALKRQSL